MDEYDALSTVLEVLTESLPEPIHLVLKCCPLWNAFIAGDSLKMQVYDKIIGRVGLLSFFNMLLGACRHRGIHLSVLSFVNEYEFALDCTYHQPVQVYLIESLPDTDDSTRVVGIHHPHFGPFFNSNIAGMLFLDGPVLHRAGFLLLNDGLRRCSLFPLLHFLLKTLQGAEIAQCLSHIKVPPRTSGNGIHPYRDSCSTAGRCGCPCRHTDADSSPLLIGPSASQTNTTKRKRPAA